MARRLQMSVANTVEAFASALCSRAQMDRIVAQHGARRVLAAVLTKRVKLTLTKDHIECFGLRVPYDLLYREVLDALRAVLLLADDRGLFTSINSAAVKMSNFTHDALIERRLDRVAMALRISRNCSLVANIHATDTFLKVVYCRYCATCLSTSKDGAA